MTLAAGRGERCSLLSALRLSFRSLGGTKPQSRRVEAVENVGPVLMKIDDVSAVLRTGRQKPEYKPVDAVDSRLGHYLSRIHCCNSNLPLPVLEAFGPSGELRTCSIEQNRTDSILNSGNDR